MGEISSKEGHRRLEEMKKEIDKKREKEIKPYRVSWVDKDLKKRLKSLHTTKSVALEQFQSKFINPKQIIKQLENIEESIRYIETLAYTRKSDRRGLAILIIGLITVGLVAYQIFLIVK